jgi:hypothetical protein
MGRKIGLSVAVLFGLLAAEPRKTGKEDLDPKALAVVKEVGALHKNAKSLHVEVALEANLDANGEKQHVKSSGTYDVRPPKQFAFRVHPEGDKEGGFELVCDGTKLYTYAKKQKEYTENPAPDSLMDISRQLLMTRPGTTGILFQNVLGDDPYEALMDNVTNCAYAGKDKVDGKEAHHITFKQPGFDWEMWVATEGKPFVLKITVEYMGAGTATETYKNWQLDAESPKDAFKFTPPEGAKKVETIGQGEG